MQTILEADRIQLAIRKVVQVEERVPFPSDLATPHPIRLIKEAEQRRASRYCVTCGGNSYGLEEHHVAGRANYPDEVTLCKPCHEQITNIYQAKWIQLTTKPLQSYFL